MKALKLFGVWALATVTWVAASALSGSIVVGALVMFVGVQVAGRYTWKVLEER